MAIQIKMTESIQDLLPHAPLLAKEEKGILALDLDYTLIAPPTIASDNVIHFLNASNEVYGYQRYTHYRWMDFLREQVPFHLCETADLVEEVIESFRSKGWEVCIVTARADTVRELTLTHMKSAGLNFDLKDVIFCGQTPKDEAIEQKAGPCTRLRVLFLDDNIFNCHNVNRLAKRIEGAVVECFYYNRWPQSPQLSDTERKELVMQLHDRKRGKEIGSYLESDHVPAMKALNMESLEDRELHRAIREVAEKDNYTFNVR